MPIYELRQYKIEPGRLADIEARWTQDIKVLFPKHGIRTLGCWVAIAGSKAPLFVYLMQWDSFEQRANAFASFAADPAWLEARARTNAGSELVERYEIQFLHELTAWCPAADSDTVHQIVLQDVAQGKGAAVRTALLGQAKRIWEEAGARVCGLFDAISGPSLPGAVFVLAWPIGTSPLTTSDQVASRLGTLLAEDGTRLLQRSDQWLLRPLKINWE